MSISDSLDIKAMLSTIVTEDNINYSPVKHIYSVEPMDEFNNWESLVIDFPDSMIIEMSWDKFMFIVDALYKLRLIGEDIIEDMYPIIHITHITYLVQTGETHMDVRCVPVLAFKQRNNGRTYMMSSEKIPNPTLLELHEYWFEERDVEFWYSQYDDKTKTLIGEYEKTSVKTYKNIGAR